LASVIVVFFLFHISFVVNGTGPPGIAVGV